MTDTQLAIILQHVPTIIGALFAGFASYMVMRVKATVDHASEPDSLADERLEIGIVKRICSLPL